MKNLKVIKFYLTREIYKELLSTYDWAKRIGYKKQKPVHVTLSLSLLYHKGFINHHTKYARTTTNPNSQYARTAPNPNGLDVLLTADQVMLLIDSSKLIGLPELTYLAASLHQENKQNKL